MKTKERVSIISVAVAACFSSLVNAATVDQTDFSRLLTEAKRKGAAPVVVHLQSTSLQQLEESLGDIKTLVGEKEQTLLAELGKEVWSAGRWSNGIGQMEVYLTENGLRMLAGSANALSFWPGKGWIARSGMDNNDGHLDRIEQQLEKSGFVDIEFVPHMENLEYEIDRSGSPRFGGERAQKMHSKSMEILESLGRDQALDGPQALAKLKQAGTEQTGTTKVRLSREGIVRLALGSNIRSIRPTGFTDSRPRQIDQDALDTARKTGSADVIVTLRNPLPS